MFITEHEGTIKPFFKSTEYSINYTIIASLLQLCILYNVIYFVDDKTDAQNG